MGRALNISEASSEYRELQAPSPRWNRRKLIDFLAIERVPSFWNCLCCGPSQWRTDIGKRDSVS